MPTDAEDESTSHHTILNNEDLSADEDDLEFKLPQPRAPRMSNEEKACAVLNYLRTINKFSLRQLLETVFTSENTDKRSFTGHFLEDGGAVLLMDLL